MWRHPSNVGFDADGGWDLEGWAMWRYVLPLDAIVTLLVPIFLELAARQVASATVERLAIEARQILT